MRALYFDGSTARLVERPEPQPPDGWCIVRPRVAGICNTDLEILRGYMAFVGVLGHELVGTVVRGPDAWIGKRVVADINFACGHCSACERGLGRHCALRTVMGIAGAQGAFADSVPVPVCNLHEVPASVTDEDAAFCEPLAAAFEILEQVHVHARTRAIVLGDGKLGLLVAQVLHAAGADLTAVGKHPDKLAILERRGICTCSLDALGDRRAELVVDATGAASGFEQALRCVTPRGTIVLKSTVADPINLHLSRIVVDEVSVVGSRCGLFQPALRALAAGTVDVASLVSQVIPFERAEEALRLAAEKGAMKVLLSMR
ncbi:MAG TPA: alcohol dehydrogenase catalytic domain-containing protein [Polyangiaceae bacterium]|nr:alcohol dehydrogenase catalytic domain-containing protein [Polyangiaceae bacterium]